MDEQDQNNDWLDPDIAQMIAELPDMLQEYTALAKKRGGLYETAETLENKHDILTVVNNVVTSINHSIVKANYDLDGKRMVEKGKLAEEMTKELNARKDYTHLSGAAGKTMQAMDKFINTGNQTPMYFFKWLNNATMSHMFDNVRQGEQDYGLKLGWLQQEVQKIKKECRYDQWAESKPLQLEFGGRKMEMTVGQAMSIYATWLREHTGTSVTETHHLEDNGFILKGATENVGKFHEKEIHIGTKVSQEDASRLYNALTIEQHYYMAKMTALMSGKVADWGNEVTMRRYGIKKYTEKYYFPMSVSSESRNQKADAGAMDRDGKTAKDGTRNMLHPGFSKRLIQHANKPLVIDDFNDVVINHCNQMITYSAFSEAMDSLNSLLNSDYTDENTGATTKIRAIFAQKYGRNAAEYLAKWIQDMQGGSIAVHDLEITDRLMSLAKASSVAASLSVAMQQPLSYVRAAYMINTKYLTKALVTNAGSIANGSFE